MSRAPITTLFAEVSTAGRGPSGFAVSVAVHCLVGGLALYTWQHSPRILEPDIVEELPVRLLTLNRPLIPHRDYGTWGSPGNAMARIVPQHSSAGGRKAATAHPHMDERVRVAIQTLVDPNVPTLEVLKKLTPLPKVVLWSPEPIRVKEVTPAPPQPVTAADVKPALTPPNHELELSDIQISQAPGATEKLALAPSSTAPLTVVRPKVVQQAPETATVPEKQPTPVAVVSITDVDLAKGTTALPPANQVASSKDTDSVHAGRAMTGATDRNVNPVRTDARNGSGQNAGDHGNLAGSGDGLIAAVSKVPSAAPGAGALNPAHTQLEGNNGTGNSGLATEGTDTGVHVSLPPNGHFGAVLVGSSLSDAFPETEGIMADRLTYTVYLQVGLPRSWILQYSLPASSERDINRIRPEAPFPYDIYWPRINAKEVTTDAILVHGLVNAAGHFEQLEIVYPHSYLRSKAFLASLDKWQFRPAMQQGLATSVEVLLIIPVS